MKSYRFTSWLAVAACLLALGMVFWPLYARGHETMGQWGRHGIAEYLYGRQIGSRDQAGLTAVYMLAMMARAQATARQSQKRT
jgi:hypothetical protein